jgi:hypothetical protein
MFWRRAVGGGGVLLVHNEIHNVPIGDGWGEVLVQPFFRTFNRTAFSSCNGESPSLNYLNVPPKFELGLLDSESKVLTITSWKRLVEIRFSFAYALREPCVCTTGNPQKSVMGAASGIKAPMRFELMSSCLPDRRFNQLSHGASQWGDLMPVSPLTHNNTPQHTTTHKNTTQQHSGTRCVRKQMPRAS